jgi:peptidoglycan/xylan/chitin deacetylase (PgdA/CDA1 family)
MATLLFFWDYDTQWGADRSRSGAKTWGHLEFPCTDRLLDLHAQYDLPACFAVVGSAALPGEHPYHDPAQVKRIHAAGHEVASHSHRHEWLPALAGNALNETLRSSKDALEQCIGTEVAAFVPPFDMPMDYPGKLAFNLTERREARPERTNLPGLASALQEVGYRFCRVTYRAFYERTFERAARRRMFDRPSQPEDITGLMCLRANCPPGFAEITLNNLEKFSQGEGYIVVYGHPHQLPRENSAEGERYLLPLLEKIAVLRKERGLKIALPRDLYT